MGKFLLLADIHANEEALRAVLNDAGTINGIWCAGDIVGYGPRPNEVCNILREYDTVAVGGNHDLSAVGRFDPHHMHGAALSCIEQHIEVLTEDNKQWLQGMPEYRFVGPKRQGVETLVMVHGRPTPKYCLDYICSASDALIAANDIALGNPLRSHHAIFGHTHIPAIWKVVLNASNGDDAVTDLLVHGHVALS